MKSTLFLIIVFTTVITVNAQQIGGFMDSRDGKTYLTTIIGNQVWMAENLAFKPDSGNYWAYDNTSSNVDLYGYLYDWQTALNVCPMGWHLPNDAEWKLLRNYVGIYPATELKAISGWSRGGNGTDNYGFAALPGGSRDLDGNFRFINDTGNWWSSTETSANSAWSRYLSYFGGDLSGDFRNNSNKQNGYSVRCLMD